MTVAHTRHPRQHRRPLVFIGGTIAIVLSLAYLVYGGVKQGASYWVTVGELSQRAPALSHQRVRVGGTVVPGTIRWDASHRTLRFVIADTPPDPRVYQTAASAQRDTVDARGTRGTDRLPVVYSGVVPDVFAGGRQVVVAGTLGRDGTFDATTLLAKCPTKYDPADPNATQ
jgi:cytochrome c-type biogenesis protein CcmE